MLEYPEALLGCPRLPYSYNRSSAVDAVHILRGRQRFILVDTSPVNNAEVHFEFSSGQMSGWQSFWANINFGVDWFLLAIPNVDASNGSSLKTCHALDPFRATALPFMRWSVTLNLEFLE